MGLKRSAPGGLNKLVEAASQRQAYNNFRKVRVLFRKVVERTPVLSGGARASWHASYGVAEYKYVDVKGNKRKVAMRFAAPQFPLEYDREKAWTIVITNGSPYIGKLEHGSSTQAPVGMMRISVLEVFGL